MNVPSHPPGSCLSMNIWIAKHQVGFLLGPSDIDWFYNMVRNGGPWDYKQAGSEYQDFGNFNYGAVGYSIGIPEHILLRGAGWAQTTAKTSIHSWGSWWSFAPYGDDPADQRMIKAGIKYAKNRGH